MKKVLMSLIAVTVFGMTTLTPQQSQAKANAVDVILTVAAIGLIVVELDNASKCGSGQYQYCDYYDNDRCEYQLVQRNDIITQCREYRRWGQYDCVTTRRSENIYIKSCNGFDRYYGQQPIRYNGR